MRLSGRVVKQDGTPHQEAQVLLLSPQFEPLGDAVLTDADGKYYISDDSGQAAYMVAVKHYQDEFLEFWCAGMQASGVYQVNCVVDTLEVYGLNCFRVAGAYPGLFVYCRPMALHLFKQAQQTGGHDIFPDIGPESVEVTIDGIKRELLTFNVVKEGIGEGKSMQALLLHVDWPDMPQDRTEHCLRLTIKDKAGNIGEAARFFVLSQQQSINPDV